MSKEQAVDPATPSLRDLAASQRRMIASMQERHWTEIDLGALAVAIDKLSTLERLAYEIGRA